MDAKLGLNTHQYIKTIKSEEYDVQSCINKHIGKENRIKLCIWSTRMSDHLKIQLNELNPWYANV